jgi:hypothetical protein
LLPDSSGTVNNAGAGIVAAWYSATDGTPTSTGPGSCVQDQATTCSVFSASSPAQGGAFGPTDSPITAGRMCASGTVARIVADAASGLQPDYGGIWGAYIGLGFNGYGGYGKGTASASNAYNATAHGIVGISFQIDAVPSAIRVEFVTAAVPGKTDRYPAYWDGFSNLSPVTAGSNAILWSDVLGPMYEIPAPAFDPTQLVAVQFTVVSNDKSPTPFSFCISNLTALTSP